MMVPWSHQLLSSAKRSFHGSRYRALGCWGKNVSHLSSRRSVSTHTGPLRQINPVASKRPAEELGAGPRAMYCKHWGPPDKRARIAVRQLAGSHHCGVRLRRWGGLHLISVGSDSDPSHWDTDCSSLMLSVSPHHPSKFVMSKLKVGAIVIAKSISSSHEYDVTYRCSCFMGKNILSVQLWDDKGKSRINSSLFSFFFPVRYLHKTLVISVKTILELEGIINIGLSIFDQRILLTFVLCLSYIYNSRLKRTNVFSSVSHTQNVQKVKTVIQLILLFKKQSLKCVGHNNENTKRPLSITRTFLGTFLRTSPAFQQQEPSFSGPWFVVPIPETA